MNSMVLVSIAIPNEKDLEVMKEAIEILESFEVHFEVVVTSAHRSPDEMVRYAKGVKEKGIEVIIAAASGAAHLPGMIAAFTTLPVIAVPLRSSLLDGLDSVLSILQMPVGVPTATVSINGAKNAAILACQIIALHNESLRHQMDEFKSSLVEEVKKQGANIKL